MKSLRAAWIALFAMFLFFGTIQTSGAGEFEESQIDQFLADFIVTTDEEGAILYKWRRKIVLRFIDVETDDRSTAQEFLNELIEITRVPVVYDDSFKIPANYLIVATSSVSEELERSSDVYKRLFGSGFDRYLAETRASGNPCVGATGLLSETKEVVSAFIVFEKKLDPGQRKRCLSVRIAESFGFQTNNDSYLYSIFSKKYVDFLTKLDRAAISRHYAN